MASLSSSQAAPEAPDPTCPYFLEPVISWSPRFHHVVGLLLFLVIRPARLCGSPR